MIIDFNQMEANEELACDVCVVGTGACGTTIGLEFLNGPFKVLMIESGGVNPEPATTDLYRSQFTGLPHPGTHTGRARIHGGTTTLWGGQALPLFPIDFEHRPWVPHSGWPISLGDLQEYYPRAAAVMQIEGTPYDEERGRRLGAPGLELMSSGIERVYSQWSPRPNFASAYRTTFARSSNVDILLHANVVNIVANDVVDAVTKLEIISLSGLGGCVKARYFILCAGGIETARLLLASRDSQPSGLGNQHDLVGRFFQDHIAVTCGRIHPTSQRNIQNIFEQYHRHGVKFLPKLRATDEFQREHRIMNVIANVTFPWPENSGAQVTKQFLGALLRRQKPNVNLRMLLRSLMDCGQLGRMAWRQFVQGRSYTPPAGEIYLEAHCEQEPNAESRITLSSERDALGMLRSNVQWEPTAASWHSIDVFARAVAAGFETMGLGRVELTLPPLEDSVSWRGRVSDVFHHMGTARMHDDPKNGVVDRDCRVHGLTNLFVGGGAVFPTGGCSSPTLTAMALCVRIGDHLKEKLRG